MIWGFGKKSPAQHSEAPLAQQTSNARAHCSDRKAPSAPVSSPLRSIRTLLIAPKSRSRSSASGLLHPVLSRAFADTRVTTVMKQVEKSPACVATRQSLRKRSATAAAMIARTPSPSRRRQRRSLAAAESADAVEAANMGDDGRCLVHTPLRTPTRRLRLVSTDETGEDIAILAADTMPLEGVLDFLSIDGSTFHLFTPSPASSGRPAMASSPPASATSSPARRLSSAFSSPSRFFRSPCSTSEAGKTRKRRGIVQTPRESKTHEEETSTSSISAQTTQPKIDVFIKDEPREHVVRTPSRKYTKVAIKQEEMEDLITLHCAEVPLSPWPRRHSFAASPSPPSRVPQLSRRLKDDFDAHDDEDDLDIDDLYCAPSGLHNSIGDQDSFFSFAHTLSPLVSADELETSFLSVRFSPLVSAAAPSCELQQLIPPFPLPKLDDEFNSMPDEKSNETNGLEAVSPRSSGGNQQSTPKTPLFYRSRTSPGSSGSSSSSSLMDSFPNIQASTSATPGKDERARICSQSIMRMKLHSQLDSSTTYPKREIQAINNSLKRKSHIRKRKLEEKRSLLKSTTSGVQRKLLHTPMKITQMRSPLHPFNGRMPRRPIVGHSHPLATPPRIHSSLPPATPSITAEWKPEKTGFSIGISLTPSSSAKNGNPFTPIGSAPKATSTTPVSTNILSAVSATSKNCASPATPMKGPPGQSGGAPATLGAGVSPINSNLLMAPVPGTTLSTAATPVTKKAPCNCKKSKCLKLYCECFASGGYCDENCNCLDCANTQATEDVRQQAIAARLEKNPNAFKPKIEATIAVATPVGGQPLTTPAKGGNTFTTPVQRNRALRGTQNMKKMHKHGCHCKKSACQKKYCECFQAGVPCGDNCRCIDCKNQAPCVAHASIGTLSATPTPLRPGDADDAFVSTVVQSVRQRLRIDRDTWEKNFSSPFEFSPRRQRERSERYRSQLQARTASLTPVRAVSSLNFRLNPYADAVTPNMIGPKKTSKSVSPLNEGTPALKDADKKAGAWGSSEERERQRQGVLVASRSASTSRILVFPLFGDGLPPVKSAVSAQIFQYLSNADLYNASLVNRLWSQVTMSDTIWDHTNFLRLAQPEEEA